MPSVSLSILAAALLHTHSTRILAILKHGLSLSLSLGNFHMYDGSYIIQVTVSSTALPGSWARCGCLISEPHPGKVLLEVTSLVLGAFSHHTDQHIHLVGSKHNLLQSPDEDSGHQDLSRLSLFHNSETQMHKHKPPVI